MSAGASSVRGAVPAEFKDPAYRARRNQNWLVLGLLYALFYMTRYNFSAVMSNLSSTFGWTNTQLGVFETISPLVYGLSVVFNGPLCDRIGGRKSFLFGAVGVTLMNFLFGVCVYAFSPPHALPFGLSAGAVLPIMATIWGFNYYFQSFGALSIVKVNAQWFHIGERGTFAGIFGVLIRFGLILAFSGVPLILLRLPLAYAFWIPGALVGGMFVANYFLMQASPKDAGYGNLNTGEEASSDDEKPAALGDVLKKVFGSRAIWMIALSSMMIGMIRRSTIDSWFPKYFKEIHLHGVGSVASFAPYQTAVWGIAVLGILGGFAFGIASDRIFGARRGPVITIGFIGMTLMLAIAALADQFGLGPWVAAVCLSLLSFFVNGAHGMIGGAASMDFGGRKGAATAAGLFDGMQYLASAPVGIGMGMMVDHWGWSYWHWLPIPFAVIGALVMSRLWHTLPGKQRIDPKPGSASAAEFAPAR